MAIVKVLSRRSPSFSSLIKYVTRYIGNEAKTEQAPVYTQNLRSKDLKGWINEFLVNESFRKNSRKDSVTLFHDIISFSSDEKNHVFTREIIEDLSREYIRLRAETTVALASPHFDKDHVHIHVCFSALHYRTGKSISLNRAQLQDLKLKFQEYHRLKYPEIEKSFPAHGGRVPYVKPPQWHARQREEVANKVRQFRDQAKSQNQFLDLLRNAEMHHYEQDGKPTGVMIDGAKLRFDRLLGGRSFDDLPMEITQEQKALDEIRAVRQRQQERNSKSRDLEDRAR